MIMIIIIISATTIIINIIIIIIILKIKIELIYRETSFWQFKICFQETLRGEERREGLKLFVFYPPQGDDRIAIPVNKFITEVWVFQTPKL